MGFFKQLKAMLKIEYIQMKRNLFLAFIEIFSPIILLFFFLIIRLLFTLEKDEYQSLYKDDIEYIFTHSTNLTNNISSDYKLEDIEKNENATIPYLYFLKQCKNIKHIALIGQNFPEEIKQKIISHFWEFDDEPNIHENKVFKYFETVEEFNKYIASKKYGKDDNNPEICFGISQTAPFKFGIHYKGINLNEESSNEIEELISLETPHIPDMRNEKEEKIRIQENLKYFEQYKNSGYLMVLKIIYDYFLQKITGDPKAEIQFSLIGMKFDEILKDNFHKFLSLLGFFIIISYAIPMSINIYKQIHLIESEKKIYLKIMGVTEMVFFLTYFIKSFLINLFHTIFNSLIVYGILKQSQYGYLFLIFLFYGLVIFSMTYFFQSFLKVSRMGVIISLLIYCIMSFVYLPMFSPVVNSILRYAFCILFPPTNLLLGLNSFFAFEREFTHLDNRITLDVAQVNISLMIIFLIVSFFLYILLGLCINNIFFSDRTYKNNEEKNKENDSSGENTASSYNSNDRTEIISEKEKTRLSKESSTNRSNTKNSYKINKSKKFANPPHKFDDLRLGEHYMDSDEEENNNFNNNNNNENVSDMDIKIQFRDYIESKAKNQADDILNKKKENLRKSLWHKKKNMIDTKNNQKDNPYFGEVDDEIEFDLDNQVEVQKIRNLRRTVISTMYNLKPEEKKYEEEINFSNIEYSLSESVMSSTEKIANLIPDNGKELDSNTFNIDNEIIPKDKNEKKIKKMSNIPGISKIEEDKGEIKEEKKKKKKKKKKKVDNDYIEEKKEEFDNDVKSKIVIKGLTKIYENSNIPVLDNISFNLKENEIYALLGQNGEGKSTFVSILTGLREATSGSIIYEKKDGNNYEILSPQGIQSIRKVMGICSQNNNILYNDLTVRENLEFFCSLKGEYEKYVIDGLLKAYNLKEDGEKELENLKVSKLSGGQKRRLMIAIACSGNNEIIILDEPTGGIDIPGKREIWEILKEQKKNKIILLITHNMDEACNNTDRIGILKGGKFIFKGTSEKLMNKFGKYITIQINKKIDKNLRNLPGIIESKFLIKKERSKNGANNLISETGSQPDNLIENSETTSSNSVINTERVEFNEYKERAVIKIPLAEINLKKMNQLLNMIENEYNVTNYYIDKNNYDNCFINAIATKKDKDKKKYMPFFQDSNYANYYDSSSKFKNELKVMFMKRLKETIRDKKSFILEILFPILLTLVSCFLCYYEILEDNKSAELFLYNMDQNQQSIFYTSLNGSNFEDIRNVLSSEIKEEQNQMPNYWFQYVPNSLDEKDDSYLESLIKYYNLIYESTKKEGIKNNTGSFYFMKADKYLHKYEFNFYISSKKKHSTIFLTNYLLRTIIRYEMKRSAVYKIYMKDIQITNSPFPLTYEEEDDKKSRNGISLVFFISIALSLIPANFITIILREKENRSKHLQMLSGASIYSYWVNNYIFEFIKYYVVVGICLIILFLFNFYEKYLVVIYIFYGPALISFTYVLSYFLETEGTGQITILLVNLFFGSLCGSAVLILRTNKKLKYFGMGLSYLFRFVPSFCICYGYNQLISKKILFAIDYFKPEEDQDLEQLKKQYFDSSYIINDPYYILSDIIYLALEFIIYTLLLFFLEKKEYFLWKFGLKKINIDNSNYNSSIRINGGVKGSKSVKKSNNKKDDGKKEDTGKTSKVKISQSNESREYLFQVKELTKSYYKRSHFGNNLFNYLRNKFCNKREKEKKLDKISLKVLNGECFCLLGANGSGKTTSFKCFSKEIEPDEGSIIIGGVNIKDFTQEQPNVGYCPQFDCIFEYLTAEENLLFYAKLKGVREDSLYNIVNTLIKELNLVKDRDRIAKLLSGGNKRKLSVGISILCRPLVILMDEPSTGMDPYSRELLLDLLINAYLKVPKKSVNSKYRALVLVTHLIQEAELISDKIGILHKAKIKKRKKRIELLQKEEDDIILSIEYEVPSKKELKSEFGDILSEEVKKEEINNFLLDINRKDYKDFFTANKFGKDIYKGIKKRGYAKKLSILKYVKYLDYTLLLTNKIKEYFDSVNCVNFLCNNYIFKIKKNPNDDKCDSRLYGIIEECKDECHIEEYNYNLTTLESIFLDTIGENKDLGKSEFEKMNISL